jgi:hypothetical protein
LRNFYTLQLRTDITGTARLLGCRVAATVQQEPKYEPNTCDSTPCMPIRCCPNGAGGGNLFTYTAPGAEGTPYYGYPYGPPYAGGDGYYPGGGYEYVPPVEDTEGGIPLPDTLPEWPVPTEFGRCGDTFNIFFGIRMEDKLQGIIRPVGIAVGPGVDPSTALEAGVLQMWAKEVWNQWYQERPPNVVFEQLVWWEIHNTLLEWSANQVFLNTAGDWHGVIDLDWKLTVAYCLQE